MPDNQITYKEFMEYHSQRHQNLKTTYTKLEEAKQRDHRKLGKELGIFMTNDLVGKGLPMYLPNGCMVWDLLENYIKGKEREIRIQTCFNSTTSKCRVI